MASLPGTQTVAKHILTKISGQSDNEIWSVTVIENNVRYNYIQKLYKKMSQGVLSSKTYVCFLKKLYIR